MKLRKHDVLVIGFALFSMFFGAGNVIFPPYLGMETGTSWLLGFASYFMADIGLAVLTIWALLHARGHELSAPLGKVIGNLLMSLIVLCISPLLAIPRTAASTYELSITPLLRGLNPVLFSVIFFAIVLFLCIRESAVVDIIGKLLTPLLLLGLLALILTGVIHPIAPIQARPKTTNVLVSGITSGYQTMDVLAAVVFGGIILKSAEAKGYQDRATRRKAVTAASLVAAFALMLVYLGLTYLGATVSRLFEVDVNRSALVLSIVAALLGRRGLMIFAVVVALACLTTAIALTSSAAHFFSRLSGGTLSYPLITVLICAFSALVSNLGLDRIINISAPILGLIYPPTLVLMLLSFVQERLPSPWITRLAALAAFLVSLLELLRDFGFTLPFLSQLPLAGLGFGWLAPALIAALVTWGVILLQPKNE